MPIPKNAVLIVIDVQKGFDDFNRGARNNLEAEKKIAELLQLWRAEKRPLIHVQHCSTLPNSVFRPGQRGNDFKPEAKPEPGETVIQKNVNSAFIGTSLEKLLREKDYGTLVITGFTTPHCISTSARMAGNLGFATYVVSDATAAWDLVGPDGKMYKAQELHDTALATLHDEFATIIDTKTLLKNLRD